MELHFYQWLRREGVTWPSDPEEFLEYDDLTILTEMRRSADPHARAIIHRERFSLAYETDEHLPREARDRFVAILPELREEFGTDQLLVDNSAKDPHRLEKNRVWVRRFDGSLLPMAEASDFIAQVSRIDCFRVYTPRNLREDVSAAVKSQWRGQQS